jgi:hypothetical protein
MVNKENLIYCIGDSHASFFSGLDGMQPAWPAPAENALPFFRVIRLGPVLAYSLSHYRSKSLGRENIFKAIRKIPVQSKVLLCFGEIDCRNHILRQAELQKRDIESVVAECVRRYTSVAAELKDMGYEIILWGVPASSSDNSPQTKEFPTYGNCINRNRATMIFNKFLADWCAANEAKFISIFDELIDDRGQTKTDIYADQIHLSQKAMPLAIARMRKIMPDFNFNALPRVTVITPSNIGTKAKITSAERALSSLQNSTKDQLPHIVVDNILNDGDDALSRLLKPKWVSFAKKVYARQGITFIRKFRGGSLGALLHALRHAYNDGADLVFIHLDDNIYTPNFGFLLSCAQDAFLRVADLAAVRLGGYPLISADCTQAQGNRSLINVESEVSFDAVHLQPDRQKSYTLWWSDFHENMSQGKFLPIAMNFTIYRVGFLLGVLSLKDIAKLHSLSDVEQYFKERANWQRVVQALPRKLGYINMQFGGINTDEQSDWQSILSLSNDEIR